MPSQFIYRQEELPPLTSDFMMTLARRLFHMKEYYHWARRPLEDSWRACDDAYLCYRELPENEGMIWADKSDFGATDIFDAVNSWSTRVSLAMMPKDESWLTVVSRQNDDAQIVKQIQDQQIWMHRKARTRRQWARHIKQLAVRGTSGILWTWEDVTRNRRLSNAVGRKKMKQFMKKNGADPKDIKLVGQVRIPETIFAGPHIRVLDSYDVFLDPQADLTNDRHSTTIVQTFRRLSDLMNEYDTDGEPMYDQEVLKTIKPFLAEDIYVKDTIGAQRLRSLNTMGVFPQNQAFRTLELVPVFIVYTPYFEHEGEEFFDTYFHIAQSADGNAVSIIRIEENPSDDGHRFVIVDTMVDWFNNTAYGISPVEKLVSKYRQKNVIEAIVLNAALVTVFPAYNVLSGVVRDDTGISFAPGAINEIAFNALGLDFIKPMPVPETGLQIGLKELQWWGQSIAEGFGTQGMYNDDPSRTLSTRETATSVNMRATSGNVAIDEIAEKLGDSLQELCQGVFDVSRQMLQGDGKNIEYGAQAGAGQMQVRELRLDEFKEPRDIEVLGLHGVPNKIQEIQELREALQVIGQAAPALPNAGVLAQTVAMQLLSKLNVSIPDEAKISPEQIAAADPRVQAMALQSLLQQRPDIAHKLAMAGGNNGAGQGQAPQGPQL